MAPANVDPSELPSGFTTGDPSAALNDQQAAASQREAQKNSILEQALTPDALQRLRRIKVRLHMLLAIVEFSPFSPFVLSW